MTQAAAKGSNDDFKSLLQVVRSCGRGSRDCRYAVTRVLQHFPGGATIPGFARIPGEVRLFINLLVAAFGLLLPEDVKPGSQLQRSGRK
jgi:hypothetical protein